MSRLFLNGKRRRPSRESKTAGEEALKRVATTIFVVDPDDLSRNSLRAIAGEMGVAYEEFPSGEDFLAADRANALGCLVAEFRLSGMSGLELQEYLLADGVSLPMLFLSHFAETRSTVRAMQQGAVTVLGKPASCQELWDALRKALARSQEMQAMAVAHRHFRRRLAKLSFHERNILPLVLAAKSNKKIAKQLNVSRNSVKAARRQILKKTCCDSVVELVQLTRESSFHGHCQIVRPSSTVSDVFRPSRESLELYREMLAQASRLTQPEIVAEIVHEMSQPLQAITNFSAIIDEALRGESPLDTGKVQRWNGMISAAAQLATATLGRLGGFVSRQVCERRDESLEEIVRESILILQFAAQEKQVTIRLNARPINARVDRAQIQQVIVNLLKNAIEAAAENPTIDRRVTVNIDSDATNALIIVSDNGRRIREEEVLNIFEPFGRTQDDGLSLSLATSKRIVECHDGELCYRPNEPRGSAFYIRLPR